MPKGAPFLVMHIRKYACQHSVLDLFFLQITFFSIHLVLNYVGFIGLIYDSTILNAPKLLPNLLLDSALFRCIVSQEQPLNLKF